MAKATDRAIGRISDRQKEIVSELNLVGIQARFGESFEEPRKTIDSQDYTIDVRTRREDQYAIRVAENVPGLSAFVRLEIVEGYSFNDLYHGRGDDLQRTKYSYTVSCKSECNFTRDQILGDEREHWDFIWLGQRKFFRFDGSVDQESWEQRDLKHRNQHPVHHFHPSAERHLRFPVPAQPSVLAVACFALISFDYPRWLASAKSSPEVLKETQKLLPHVVLG